MISSRHRFGVPGTPCPLRMSDTLVTLVKGQHEPAYYDNVTRQLVREKNLTIGAAGDITSLYAFADKPTTLTLATTGVVLPKKVSIPFGAFTVDGNGVYAVSESGNYFMTYTLSITPPGGVTKAYIVHDGATLLTYQAVAVLAAGPTGVPGVIYPMTGSAVISVRETFYIKLVNDSGVSTVDLGYGTLTAMLLK